MKGKLSLLILALALFAVSASANSFYDGAFAHPKVGAQTGAGTTHTVTLTWSDSKNPTGTTYTAYRATGLCSGTPAFSKLATGITVLTFADTTVTPGNYCYQVTAVLSGLESAASNQAPAAVLPFAVTSLSTTVQ